MSWGAIYSQSWWGRAIANDFGEVYSDEVNIKPLLKAIQDRSTYYENEAGTTALLQQLEECQLVETLGEELIVNGDFSDGSTGWTLGAGWSVVDGKLTNSSSSVNFNQLLQENYLNKKVLVEFDILNIGVVQAILTFDGNHLLFFRNSSRDLVSHNIICIIK